MSKSYIDTRATSKTAKTIVLLTKWDSSKSFMKIRDESASESASAHCNAHRCNLFQSVKQSIEKLSLGSRCHKCAPSLRQNAFAYR